VTNFWRWLVKGESGSRKWPQTEEGARIYAIGDIHGRLDLLDRLLDKIINHAKNTNGLDKQLIFLGDYIDRGPDSKGVIDRIVGLKWPRWKLVALRGNHDQMVLEFFNNPDVYQAWREFGADETIMSYQVRPPSHVSPSEYARVAHDLKEKLPPSHLNFIQESAYSHFSGDYMFVHAGIRPSIPLNEQTPDDLMWIREDFLRSKRRLDKVIVHGHTPTPTPVVKPYRIGIDTGAYATECLTALVLESEKKEFLQTE
jgi:serine/threonine protein phosphatase 1